MSRITESSDVKQKMYVIGSVGRKQINHTFTTKFQIIKSTELRQNMLVHLIDGVYSAHVNLKSLSTLEEKSVCIKTDYSLTVLWQNYKNFTF